MTTVFTIGHSTHSIDEFIALLRASRIKTLADIRTIPRSRHNPQFEQDNLAASLKKHHIAYKSMKGLGGLRHPKKDSPNRGWRNSSFRGYADYMLTEEFKQNLDELVAFGKAGATAIMCAEAVPWRCHRSLVSDALLVRGIDVIDIMPGGKTSPHKLNPMAHVEHHVITYPPETLELSGI